METDHKTFERLIPAFLADELNNAQLSRFLKHMDSCGNCKEELTIQFLMQIGTQRLEEARAFNLGNELDAFVDGQRALLTKRQRLERMSFALQASVFLALIVLAVLLFFFL